MIVVCDVIAGYEGKIILREINLSLNYGVNVTLGPNGSGKTTLLRVCAGVLKPYRGYVSIDGYVVGEDVECKKLIGYLPHSDGLFEDLSVYENLMFYKTVYELDDNTFRARLESLAKLFGVEEILNQKVYRPSRGQRRKVALVRTLLHDPRVLILDEPTSGLDPVTARNFREYLKKLVREKHIIVLYSTHNLLEALELADTVIVMKYGKVVFQGSLDELRRLLGRVKVGLKTNADPRPILASAGYRVERQDDLWVIEVESQEEIAEIVSRLVESGVKVFEVKEIETSLEEFLRRVG